MIKLCIFDVKCILNMHKISPITSAKYAFNLKGININEKLLKNNINTKDKYHYIKNIANDEYVSKLWFNKNGKYPLEKDIRSIYEEYILYQLENDNIEILPNVRNCVNKLGDNNISTALITNNHKLLTSNIRDKLNENNIYFNMYISNDCINNYTIKDAINKCANNLSLKDYSQIVCVEKNLNNIITKKKLGITTIGVSNYRWKLRDDMYKVGVNYVSDTLDIYPIINSIK